MNLKQITRPPLIYHMNRKELYQSQHVEYIIRQNNQELQLLTCLSGHMQNANADLPVH